jgi:protoporphyrinogen oxidase
MPNTSGGVAILGAGPAGLTAGWELCRLNFDGNVRILESDSQVGGISKTVQRDGWRFDLGGHRFFSKSTRVNLLWDEMLEPDSMILRPRKSRIYYRGKFFDYPLKPLNALVNLGVFETVYCILSYLIVRILPPRNQSTFEGWVAARFGWRLYKIFFKTYTEKVWGISTTQLQATWAAQRIKNLSLKEAIFDALGFRKKSKLTSLIENFKYPEFGPGQLWESVESKLRNQNVQIDLNSKVLSVESDCHNYRILDSNGTSTICHAIFSSLPLSIIPELLGAPTEIKEAAQNLKHRDFLVVCIPVANTDSLFDDNWIYIHDPLVKVGRIQNYASWSPSMVRPQTSCLGLEYFVNKDDELWSAKDQELVNLALKELETLGIEVEVLDSSGFVVRVEKAYPVYDSGYSSNVDSIRSWLSMEHPNWYQIGRNGQHRYNNQDHSMLTAALAVESYLNTNPQLDYWNVNLGDDYLEEDFSTREAPIYVNKN